MRFKKGRFADTQCTRMLDINSLLPSSKEAALVRYNEAAVKVMMFFIGRVSMSQTLPMDTLCKGLLPGVGVLLFPAGKRAAGRRQGNAAAHKLS